MTQNPSSLPCAGLRVLDFGQGYGAIPGMILADYGADVVKVEPPEGELCRDAPAFLQWNRGKRGIVLDLRDAGDRARAVELALASDVLIQGFRPAAAARFGIDDQHLRDLAPRLVHVSISGFGPTGPYADTKAYEGIVAAATGQYAIQNGYRAGGPIYDAIPKCSFGAAMLALIGALAALEAREVTGLGQAVSSTLLRSNFVYSYTGIRAERAEAQALLSQVQGRDPHNEMPGYRIARCSDGQWIQSGSAAGRTFENMMKALGINEYFGPDRPQGPELLALIDAAYARAPLAEWLKVLDEHDAAYGTFMTTQEFMDYPQVRHNGHVVEVDDPRVGPMEQVGPLARFAGMTWEHPGPAPDLGQHTAEVLAEQAPPEVSPTQPGQRPLGRGLERHDGPRPVDVRSRSRRPRAAGRPRRSGDQDRAALGRSARGQRAGRQRALLPGEPRQGADHPRPEVAGRPGDPPPPRRAG